MRQRCTRCDELCTGVLPPSSPPCGKFTWNHLDVHSPFSKTSVDAAAAVGWASGSGVSSSWSSWRTLPFARHRVKVNTNPRIVRTWSLDQKATRTPKRTEWDNHRVYTAAPRAASFYPVATSRVVASLVRLTVHWTTISRRHLVA